MSSMSYDTKQFLLHYWQDIGTPLSLKFKSLLEADKVEEIVRLLDKVSPPKNSVSRLALFRLTVDIIKKADYLLDNTWQRREACFTKWAAAEMDCRRTNHLLQAIRDVGFKIPSHVKDDTIQSIDGKTFSRLHLLVGWMPRIRKEFRRIIRDVPSIWEFTPDDVFGGFGPGATLSNPRRLNSIIHKLNATPTLTRDAVWYIPALPKRLRDVWRLEAQPDEVMAGELAFVPKTYKTDRSIMIEPLVNASIQRYFGAKLRERLLQTGIDVKNGQEKHRQLAQKASLDQSYATLDLSSASDTVSLELVKYLVPENWYKMLDSCRTSYVDLGDAWYMYADYACEFGVHDPIYKLEKFSSMGNGFTFELETMIFLSICRAVLQSKGIPRREASVYGDDIVVPDVKDVVMQLHLVLTACGFTVNDQKSFYKKPGHMIPFRESCGGDYCSGVDVKGVTLKTEPTCSYDWMELHNRIWVKAGFMFDRTLNFIRKRVPKAHRLRVPVGLTGGFYSHRPPCKTIDGITYYRCLIPTISYDRKYWDSCNPSSQLAAGLLGGIPTDGKGHVIGTVRHRDIPCHRLAWVPLS